jgi:hypothetical protein
MASNAPQTGYAPVNGLNRMIPSPRGVASRVRSITSCVHPTCSLLAMSSYTTSAIGAPSGLKELMSEPTTDGAARSP